MEGRVNKTASNKISFVSYIIPAFAEAYKVNVRDTTYRYLKKYLSCLSCFSWLKNKEFKIL